MDITFSFDEKQKVAIESVIKVCRKNGIKGFIVGGAVRDAFLEISPMDIDMCFEEDPRNIIQEFDLENFVYHDAFSTATVRFKNGVEIDFIRCRKEVYKRNGALPTIIPSDIKDDLERRDFTVNALAYDVVEGVVIDPFGGIADIKAKKIKSSVTYSHSSFTKSLKEMYQNHNLRGIFWLAMLLNVFFNATTVFIPIYLNRVVGFTWVELGLMFSIMLLPFLFIEIPAGIIADKYLGEKEMLALGYLIMIICLCLFFTSNSVNFWFWTALLFVSRIGAALVEAMRESYFFKNVCAKDVEKINIFRTTIPIGYLFGSLLSLVVLIFLPMSYIFPITAIILCSAFPFLAIIKDTR